MLKLAAGMPASTCSVVAAITLAMQITSIVTWFGAAPAAAEGS
jgi:hypothetical protein